MNCIHLPGINGLRALAALSVLWGHCFQGVFGNWGIPNLHLDVVGDGVTMFFVISGFLITYLLLNELKNTNDVSIPKFYMRRILRIWPIYFGYIIIVILLLWYEGRQNDVLNSTLWYYGLFAANIPFVLMIALWPFVHLWSIGVEEQFYLFWPWIMKLGKQNILYYAVSILVFWLVGKYGSYFLLGKGTIYRFFSVTRFDCMMLGAIGAILYFHKNKILFKILDNKYINGVSWILLLGLMLYGEYIPAPIRIQYIAFISLFVLLGQLGNHPIINMENKVCDFVGKISYGIYVIHPILIYVLSMYYISLNIGWPLWLQYIIICVGVTAITIGVAWLSYRYFESSFLRLKDRFSIVKSTSTIS